MIEQASRPWVLYGPGGVTGRMILAEAVARGHRPILAGRSATRLAPLAARHGLAVREVDIGNPAALAALCGEAGLILNAAGPFAVTGPPVLAAALAAGCDYLDVNGELEFLLAALDSNAAARARGVAAVVGVGFGVVAGDCAGLMAAQTLAAQGATPAWLRLAIAPASGFSSPAVAESTVAALGFGGRRVIDGRMTARRLADRRWRETGADGVPTAFAAAPLAELGAAFASTGIADIVAGTPMPRTTAAAVALAAPLLRHALKIPALRRQAVAATGHSAAAPADPATLVSRVWATAGGDNGATASVLFETGEAYGYAARSAIAAVEALRGGARRPGVLTPAQAFGADFATRIGGATTAITGPAAQGLAA